MNTTSNISHFIHRVAVRLVIVLTVVSTACAQIVFSDGDFGGGDWSFETSTALGASASASRISSGGNPGAYLQISLSMAAGDGYSVLWGFNSSAVYVPASSAIEAVGYREDLMQGGSPQAAGTALLQNGLRYYRYAWTTDQSVWTTRIATPDVGASGYVLDDSQNNGSNPLNPNFSILGAPITFGFFRNISGTALSDFTTTSRLDNWTTTVTPVPEPSIAHLVAATVIALVASRFLKKLVPRRRRVAVHRQRRLP
jgi:hypothetical protein